MLAKVMRADLCMGNDVRDQTKPLRRRSGGGQRDHQRPRSASDKVQASKATQAIRQEPA